MQRLLWRQFRNWLGALAVALVAVSFSDSARADLLLNVEGTPAVGQPSGVKYWSTSFGDISPNGVITFSAKVGTSATGTLTTVGYIGLPGAFNPFAKQGDAFPSAGVNDTITSPGFVGLSNTGVGVGVDTFSGANGGTNSQAITFGNVSSFISIAAPGQAAPAGGNYDTNFSNFNAPAISLDGNAVFSTELSVAFGGVFLYSNSTMSAVAVAGNTAPGLGVPFRSFNASPNIGNGGVVSFVAQTGVPGNTGPNGIWSGGVGSLQLIAVTGGAAPGAGSGVSFQNLQLSNEPPVNPAGKLAFRGQVSGTNVTTANDTGIWSNISGTLGLIAREGDQAPGMSTGVKYGDFGGGQSSNDPVLNNAGEIAFPVSFTGTTVPGAIYEGLPGSLKPVVLAGTTVPGLPSSITTLGFYDLDMNASGQLVFMANLTGQNLNSFDSLAILDYDPNGEGLGLIAWEGQQLPGTNITPNIHVFYDGGSGQNHPTVLSDSGEVIFSETSNSGSSLVLATIPEPGSAVLFTISAAFILSRRRFSRRM